MKKEEIIRLAQEYCDQGSNKSVEYQLYEGDDQFLGNEKGVEGGYDLWLNNETYRAHSFTIVVRNRNDMSYIARTTLFLMEYDIYKDVFFWTMNEDQSSLVKVRLDSYKDVVGDLCIRIGYTEIDATIRLSYDLFNKLKMASDMLKFAKKLVSDPQNFVFFNPAGHYLMPEEFLEHDTLVIADDADMNTFGEVRPESQVAYELAQKLKMHKMDTLYEDVTLGPVFFSKVC